MGNQNMKISQGGFGLISAGKMENISFWLDKTKWDREVLLEKVKNKEVAPFERPKLIRKEYEEEILADPKKSLGAYEKCPVCILYFRRGLNQCKKCHMKVCSHCFFRVKNPPRLWIYYEGNDKTKEVSRENVDDSECVFCEDCPWEVELSNEKDRKEGQENKMVQVQKKAMANHQQMAMELFKSLQEKNKKKSMKERKKKSKKKPKKKKEEQEEEIREQMEKKRQNLSLEDDDDDGLKKQIAKMLPDDLGVNDLVETEEKLMEHALEEEMERTNEIPDIGSKEYKKIKRTVSMAMYGTVKHLKVAELRKADEDEAPKKKVLFQKEKNDDDGDDEKKDEEFFDFVL